MGKAANAVISPLIASDDLPAVLREHLRGGRSNIFDSVVLAIQTRALLVTDDLATRDFARLVGVQQRTWLHQIYGAVT